MTKSAAMDLGEYLFNRFKNYIVHDEPIQMHPNMLTVGDWLNENNIQPERLSFYYNHILDDITDRPWTNEDKKAGFWHLYGKKKSEKLEYVLKHIDV